ncbi:MAG: hypothetical protein AAGF49_17140 [Pseudomonadota bacterium]
MGAQAQTQTLGYADAIRILANSCGADIQKHCASARLANWGINKCLAQNEGKLSAQCNADRVRVRQAVQARLDAQAAAVDVCKNDARRLCYQTVPGKGHVLQCLLKSERSVGKRCNQAITDAGWR